MPVTIFPRGQGLVKKVLKEDRLPEVDSDFAKIVFKCAENTSDVPDGLFLLTFTLQLSTVGATFKNSFVTKIYRHKTNRFAEVAQIAVHSHA